MTANDLFEEIADRVISRASYPLIMKLVPDDVKVVRDAIVAVLKEMSDELPIGQIAIARALAEREGRGWLFTTGCMNRSGDVVSLLRDNYLGDARALLARVKELTT